MTKSPFHLQGSETFIWIVMCVCVCAHTCVSEWLEMWRQLFATRMSWSGPFSCMQVMGSLVLSSPTLQVPWGMSHGFSVTAHCSGSAQSPILRTASPQRCGAFPPGLPVPATLTPVIPHPPIYPSLPVHGLPAPLCLLY